MSISTARILLATDGSGEASLAEEAAVDLARGTGSELHVVYVVSTVPELPYPELFMNTSEGQRKSVP